jgi:hypothetical protein
MMCGLDLRPLRAGVAAERGAPGRVTQRTADALQAELDRLRDRKAREIAERLGGVDPVEAIA